MHFEIRSLLRRSAIKPRKGRDIMETDAEDVEPFPEFQIDEPADALADSSTSWVLKLDRLSKQVLSRYIDRHPESRRIYEEATEVMPGGNTRSVLYYEPFPMALVSGRDCYVTSADGIEYLDFVSEYSAAMFGHSHPTIFTAIHQAMTMGINLGGPGKAEIEVAKSIKARFTSIATLRFCNSGSEANTMALALAIAFTKKRKILAFENGYHGGFIGFGTKPHSTTIPHEFVLGRFNDVEYSRSLLDNDFAAIIVEPMQGVGGMTPGTREFLQCLRESATKYGILLIFDEVVTSRLHINGLQGHFGITPDITTLGKYLGGGPSFGAFGGREDVMDVLDPRLGSEVSHSGTYNNNVFTMAAATAAAKILKAEGIDRANRLGDALRDGMNSVVKKYKIQHIEATGMGSMIGIHFTGPAQVELRKTFFLYALSRSVYIGRRGFLALNLMHEYGHINRLLRVFSDFMEEIYGDNKQTGD